VARICSQGIDVIVRLKSARTNTIHTCIQIVSESSLQEYNYHASVVREMATLQVY
jgi:hypothetical protein